MSEEIRGAHRLVAHHDAERERKATARPLESGEWIARSAYRVDPAPRERPGGDAGEQPPRAARGDRAARPATSDGHSNALLPGRNDRGGWAATRRRPGARLAGPPASSRAAALYDGIFVMNSLLNRARALHADLWAPHSSSAAVAGRAIFVAISCALVFQGLRVMIPAVQSFAAGANAAILDLFSHGG